MSDAAPLHGLVLAGGQSRRFGSDKAAVSVGGQALLQRTVALVTPLVRDCRVSIRAGQRDDAVRAQFPLLVDRLADGGPAAGLLAAHAESPAAAWLVVACDLPLLDAATLSALVSARQPEREATAYVSADGCRPEPLCAIYEPLLLARLATLAAQGGNLSPRDLLAGGDTRLLQPERPEVLANVNRPADLARLQERGLC